MKLRQKFKIQNLLILFLFYFCLRFDSAFGSLNSHCSPYPNVFDTPKSERKISLLNLDQKLLNEIKNEKTNKNNQIFKEYYYYDPAPLQNKNIWRKSNQKFLKQICQQICQTS